MCEMPWTVIVNNPCNKRNPEFKSFNDIGPIDRNTAWATFTKKYSYYLLVAIIKGEHEVTVLNNVK